MDEQPRLIVNTKAGPVRIPCHLSYEEGTARADVKALAIAFGYKVVSDGEDVVLEEK